MKPFFAQNSFSQDLHENWNGWIFLAESQFKQCFHQCGSVGFSDGNNCSRKCLCQYNNLQIDFVGMFLLRTLEKRFQSCLVGPCKLQQITKLVWNLLPFAFLSPMKWKSRMRAFISSVLFWITNFGRCGAERYFLANWHVWKTGLGEMSLS